MQAFDLERLKDVVLVARVLELNGVAVNHGRARCPLPGHCEGKHGASFAIYDDGRRWTCHRCHAAGDVFNLLALLEGSTVGEAIRRAAAFAGIAPGGALPSRGPKPEDPERQRRRLVGEVFRTVADIRDLLQRIAADTCPPMEIRATALAGVVLCNRKLELIIGGDVATVTDILAEFEVRP